MDFLYSWKGIVLKHYLIDFENVFTAELDLIERFPDDSILHIFYSRNKPVIDMDILERFNNANLRFYKIHKDKDRKEALDKQLLCFLGWLAGKDTKGEDSFCIIAKDKGYEDAVRFFSDNFNIKIRLMQHLPTKKNRLTNEWTHSGKNMRSSRGIFQARNNIDDTDSSDEDFVIEPYPDDTDLPVKQHGIPDDGKNRKARQRK